jgi:hypothetical protein
MPAKALHDIRRKRKVVNYAKLFIFVLPVI